MNEPTPVEIVAVATPLPVVLSGPKPAHPGVQQQELDPSIPAKTTFQEDLTTAGQRRINVIWEYTQAAIALLVISANMIVGVYRGLTDSTSRGEYPIILSSSLFLIVGFYFSRTNHAAIGGVGRKPIGQYDGR